MCVNASQATAQGDRANAALIVSFAQICVVVTMNFATMLILRKFWKMIPVMISTMKKERTTNSFLQIHMNCLLAVLVYVFYLFTFYEGHRIIRYYTQKYSYLRSGKQNLRVHLF